MVRQGNGSALGLRSPAPDVDSVITWEAVQPQVYNHKELNSAINNNSYEQEMIFPYRQAPDRNTACQYPDFSLVRLQGGEDSACAPGNGGRCLSRTVWPEEGVWPWFLTQRAASAPQSGAISGGWGGHRAELQCSHLRNGVASPLGSELGWAGLLREGASW